MTLPKGYKRPLFSRKGFKHYLNHPSDESIVFVGSLIFFVLSFLSFIYPDAEGGYLIGNIVDQVASDLEISRSVIYLFIGLCLIFFLIFAKLRLKNMV